MRKAGVFGLALLTLAGCDRFQRQADAPQQQVPNTQVTVPLNQQQQAAVAGATPMAQRVAVLGFLNKRNGIARDLTLRPGQSVRIDDVIVRLRACETTPPWEFDKWTGAFVDVDVQQPAGGMRRVFSGWLYKESPSLNVVEHPVYDVWPKSCVMSFPGAPESAPAPEDDSSPSSAPQSAGGRSPAARASESNVT